jgi:hypothetical protein
MATFAAPNAVEPYVHLRLLACVPVMAIVRAQAGYGAVIANSVRRQ